MRRFFRILWRRLGDWLSAWLARRGHRNTSTSIECGGDVVHLPCTLLGGSSVGADDSTFHNLRRPSIANAPQMAFEKT